MKDSQRRAMWAKRRLGNLNIVYGKRADVSYVGGFPVSNKPSAMTGAEAQAKLNEVQTATKEDMVRVREIQKAQKDFAKEYLSKPSKPKNLCAKRRTVDSPYETWKSPDGSMEYRILKKNQIDDDKPYASWYVAGKSPMTGGSWEYGDMYVGDIKKNMKKVN